MDTLRTFRYLTPSEFVKQGGVRGLDRMYVKRHLCDAARILGLERMSLLKALVRLTTEDGAKT